jgi:hypothetical protein
VVGLSSGGWLGWWVSVAVVAWGAGYTVYTQYTHIIHTVYTQYTHIIHCKKPALRARIKN